jgi:hypothetical protein
LEWERGAYLSVIGWQEIHLCLSLRIQTAKLSGEVVGDEDGDGEGGKR